MCEIDSSAISLKDGTVGDVQTREVPYVRFRKQLSSAYEVPELYRTFGDREVARAKENTVFVVNSMYLQDFLADFELDNGNTNAKYLA